MCLCEFSCSLLSFFMTLSWILHLLDHNFQFSPVQFTHSVVSKYLQPHDCSTLGFPVHHQLPKFIQTHIHRVSDAIQLSHPLSSPFPPAPNPSQHQSLFQWVLQMHGQRSKPLSTMRNHGNMESQRENDSFPWTNSTSCKIVIKQVENSR